MAKKVSMPGASWPKWEGDADSRYTMLKSAYDIALATLDQQAFEGEEIPVLTAAAIIGVSPHGLVRLLKEQYGMEISMLGRVYALTALNIWKRQEWAHLDRWDRELSLIHI